MGRIAIGQDMAQFSCKLDADPALWDARAGRVNGKSNHALTVNRRIDKINVAINSKYREIISLKGKASANDVKNAWQGISSLQDTLLKIFGEHNEEYKKRLGVNIAKSTWINYENSLTHLKRFINHKYRVSDVSFRQLDYSFILDYEYYLRINCKMKSSTILHKISSLQKMIETAIEKGIINRSPFAVYSPERSKSTPKFIPANELEILIKTPLISPALRITRDMFVFACFTGLSYIDLYNLTDKHIVKADDGSLWLNTSRKKTDNDSKIPLLDIPLELIEKYRGSGTADRIFPIKGNGLVNLQLKTIAKLCGIERRLTFHMSRHTFATETCLSMGVPLESVSRMLGHKKISTTQIYAKVTQNKVDEDMDILSKNIFGKYVLAS
jgi:site-specific recombinase XerD